MEDIQIRIKSAKKLIKEDEIKIKILLKIKESNQFLSIMESLIALGKEEIQSVILDIMIYLGESDYYKNIIKEKLKKINNSFNQLMIPENEKQTYLYLTHSTYSYIK